MLFPLIQKFSLWLREQPTLGRWALNCLPDWPLAIQIAPIGRFHIRLRRNRSFWLRHPLTHELFPLGALQRLIRPGMVVYDVGANIGVYARFMTSVCNAGTVICFEPMTENRELFEKNLRESAFQQRVRLMPCALSDADGEENLQVDDMMSGSAVLDRVTGGKPCQGRSQYGMGPRTELVHVARLDDLITAQNLPVPDVIKVDIEGAEAFMLAGSQETLRRHRPDLLIELHGAKPAQNVFALLNSLGYSCFGEGQNGEQRTYRRITPEIVSRLSDYYDLHFLLASMNRQKLQQPIAPYDLEAADPASVLPNTPKLSPVSS